MRNTNSVPAVQSIESTLLRVDVKFTYVVNINFIVVCGFPAATINSLFAELFKILN